MPSLIRSIRKGVECGNYKFFDEASGKNVDTGTSDKDLATQYMEGRGIKVEMARPSFADLAKSLDSTTQSTSSNQSPTIPDAVIPPDKSPSLATQTKPEKASPGTIRKNGLSELSPSKIAKLKESLAAIVSSGNIDAIRLTFSLLGFETADLDPNGQALLGLGWEAQLEELFVGGLPPPWLILLIANITLTVKLGLSAKEKTNGVSVEVKTIGQQTK